MVGGRETWAPRTGCGWPALLASFWREAAEGTRTWHRSGGKTTTRLKLPCWEGMMQCHVIEQLLYPHFGVCTCCQSESFSVHTIISFDAKPKVLA